MCRKKSVFAISLLALLVTLVSCKSNVADDNTLTSPNADSTSGQVSVEKGKIVADSQISNGSLAFSKEEGEIGETIEVYTTPNEGYEVEEVTSDGEVLKKKVQNVYLLTLKAGDNIVSAKFKKIEPSYDLNINEANTLYHVHQRGQKPSLNSIGEQKLLIIPVIVKDYADNATELNKTNIQKAFFGKEGETGYESVATYFQKSSYGKLTLTGKVTDWFDSGLTAAQIAAQGKTEDGDGGTWKLLDSAIAWYKKTYTGAQDSITQFDNDKDGYIDGVWLVYSAPNYKQDPALKDLSKPFWGFTYYDKPNVGKGDINDPLPMRYSFASYDFMYASNYASDLIDPHTYIHETGHLLGLEDYYDATGTSSPFGYIDMMDHNVGDYNSFSKFALGWASPTIINGTTKVTLPSAEDTGKFLILRPDDFNDSPFDEYFMIELLTPTGLNKQDYLNGYYNKYNDTLTKGFTKPGIRITHVNSLGIDKDGNGTSDPNKVASLPVTNTVNNILIDPLTNVPYRNLTIMQKDYSSQNSIMTLDYQFSENQLVYAGDVFTLDPDSPWRNLMPSQSNILDNGSLFSYSVTVDKIDETGASLSIYKY